MGKGLKSLSCDGVLTRSLSEFESGYKLVDAERSIYKVRRTLHNVEFSYLVIGDRATAFLLGYLDTLESFSALKKSIGNGGFKIEDAEGYVLYYPKFRITYASKFASMEELLSSFGIDNSEDYHLSDASFVDGVDGEGIDSSDSSVVVGEFCWGSACSETLDEFADSDSSDDCDDEDEIEEDNSDDGDFFGGFVEGGDSEDYATLVQQVEFLTKEVAEAKSALEANSNLLSSMGDTFGVLGQSLKTEEHYLALEDEVSELRKREIQLRSKSHELTLERDNYVEKYKMLENLKEVCQTNHEEAVKRVNSLESSLQKLQSEYAKVSGIKRSHDQLHSKLFGSFIERIKFLFTPRTWFNKNMKK